ncbi:electron transport complex subunit RsxE [Seleniivibrio woodruffii]|uniref:Ion-translocating oxidoreductase complex subunit E n=1 Tax=Seleniivibrio woodruffii TaxID=1078050 RepID=A0A4R1KEL5_9BACT|nr:electron transport complex subunit E [Seleniivibrio woodruffii]TCK62577.1 electron transport complex protein RnfE [Seleniivibrio woodruffii]TVZ36997.1 electron transport complex protein RnfE [Seleniivibrio woodruffii]
MKLSILTEGIFKNNPVMKQVLGLCPTLAVTTSAINGIAMGLATMCVLMGSNVAVSLVKNIIPAKVRIPAYVVIIATFVTVIDLAMNAFVHDLHKILGLFIPLIVVNCIVLGRAESFASKNGVFDSLLDGIGSGLGFTLTLFVLGSVREVLGNGSWLGLDLFGASFSPSILMILPPGAFIVLGFLMAFNNYVEERRRINRGGIQ